MSAGDDGKLSFLLVPKVADTSCRSTVSVAAVALLGDARLLNEPNNHVLANLLAKDPRLDWFLSLFAGVPFGVEAPDGSEIIDCDGDVSIDVMLAIRICLASGVCSELDGRLRSECAGAGTGTAPALRVTGISGMSP